MPIFTEWKHLLKNIKFQWQSRRDVFLLKDNVRWQDHSKGRELFESPTLKIVKIQRWGYFSPLVYVTKTSSIELHQGKKKKQQKNALLISEKKLTEYLLLLQELLKL